MQHEGSLHEYCNVATLWTLKKQADRGAVNFFLNRAQRQKASSHDGGPSSRSVDTAPPTHTHTHTHTHPCFSPLKPCSPWLRSGTGQGRKMKGPLTPDPQKLLAERSVSPVSPLVDETSVVCDVYEAVPGGVSRFLLKTFGLSFSWVVSLCRSCGAFFWYVGLWCIGRGREGKGLCECFKLNVNLGSFCFLFFPLFLYQWNEGKRKSLMQIASGYGVGREDTGCSCTEEIRFVWYRFLR